MCVALASLWVWQSGNAVNDILAILYFILYGLVFWHKYVVSVITVAKNKNLNYNDFKVEIGEPEWVEFLVDKNSNFKTINIIT